jgi:hypothetical protein
MPEGALHTGSSRQVSVVLVDARRYSLRFLLYHFLFLICFGLVCAYARLLVLGVWPSSRLIVLSQLVYIFVVHLLVNYLWPIKPKLTSNAQHIKAAAIANHKQPWFWSYWQISSSLPMRSWLSRSKKGPGGLKLRPRGWKLSPVDPKDMICFLMFPTDGRCVTP